MPHTDRAAGEDLRIARRLRYEEMRRRTAELPREMGDWRKRVTEDADKNAHNSQLQAIASLVGVLLEACGDDLERLGTSLTDPEAEAASETPGFDDVALEVTRGMQLAQKTWDFFRDKLDQRFSDGFRDFLWTADTVAWDCHRFGIENAAKASVVELDAVRAPPLTYLEATFSPATWQRGDYPGDGLDRYLGEASLPIPVIQIPWENAANVWDLVVLAHEVGHNLEADLGLRPALRESLLVRLRGMGVSPFREECWMYWLAEVFADLVGVQLAGPTYADVLADLLTLPRDEVILYRRDDPHPTPLLRIPLVADYLETLVPDTLESSDTAAGERAKALRDQAHDTAARLRRRWETLYGLPKPGSKLADLLGDFAAVHAALMDTALPPLAGVPAGGGAAGTVRALLPYTAADEYRVSQTASYLDTGEGGTGEVSVRHIASAARRAAASAARDAPEGELAGRLTEIHAGAVRLIRARARPGLRVAPVPGQDRMRCFAAALRAAGPEALGRPAPRPNDPAATSEETR